MTIRRREIQLRSCARFVYINRSFYFPQGKSQAVQIAIALLNDQKVVLDSSTIKELAYTCNCIKSSPIWEGGLGPMGGGPLLGGMIVHIADRPLCVVTTSVITSGAPCAFT